MPATPSPCKSASEPTLLPLPIDDTLRGTGAAGINAHGAVQSIAADLHRAKVEDVLTRKLQHRPTKTEVAQRNILKSGQTDPHVQATLDGMERQMLEQQLNQNLARRPGPLDLVSALSSFGFFILLIWRSA